jgi:hypothetical protein
MHPKSSRRRRGPRRRQRRVPLCASREHHLVLLWNAKEKQKPKKVRENAHSFGKQAVLFNFGAKPRDDRQALRTTFGYAYRDTFSTPSALQDACAVELVSKLAKDGFICGKGVNVTGGK